MMRFFAAFVITSVRRPPVRMNAVEEIWMMRESASMGNMTELELVRSLGQREISQVETAMAQLWQLWPRERGEEGLKRLERVDELMKSSHEEAVRECEALIREEPEWAEPKNRLAMLYFLMGEYRASIDLCEAVLELKPHHFGALAGLMECHLLLDDITQARHWASRKLPMKHPERRKAWAQARHNEFKRL